MEYDINSFIVFYYFVKYYINYYLDIILYMMFGINCFVKFYDVILNNVLMYSGFFILEG